MSLGDVIKIVQGGGPDAIFLLLLFCGLVLSNRICIRREVEYRDALISKQDERLGRQQDLFDEALKLIRDQLEHERRKAS